jgi:hypothetical protein
MRRLGLFTTGVLFGVAAFGQDLLECVDPDVLRGLVFTGNSPVISTAVPAEMSGVGVPSQFGWIGSAQRNLGQVMGSQTTSVTAAYGTTLSVDAARDLAVKTLESEGWNIVPAPAMGGGVFTSASFSVPWSACRGDEAVTVTANRLDGKTYVLYGASRGGNSTACDTRFLPTFTTGLDEHMPSLELPSDPATGAAARVQSSGGGSSGGGRNARVEFGLDDSASNVASHFARQMAAQGWVGDASWSGTSTAGSSWSKTPDAETTILSTLQVTEVGDSQFMAVLRIVAL